MDRQWYRSQSHIYGKVMSEKGVTFSSLESHVVAMSAWGLMISNFIIRSIASSTCTAFPEPDNPFISPGNYLLHGYQLYLGCDYTLIPDLMSYMFNLILRFLHSLTVTSLMCGNLDPGKILSKSRWLPRKHPSTGEISSFPSEELPS